MYALTIGTIGTIWCLLLVLVVLYMAVDILFDAIIKPYKYQHMIDMQGYIVQRELVNEFKKN